MSEVIYYVAASVDGYIATPDGGVDWLSAYNAGGEDYGYAAFYESVDGLIEGSRTYEQAAAFAEWPHPGKPCWVCSKRALKTNRPEVKVTSGAPKDLVAELRRLGLRRIWLVGGAQLAASFRMQGLIDQYIVTFVPTVLGGGIPLLASSGASERLTLTACTKYPDGVVQLSYARGTR